MLELPGYKIEKQIGKGGMARVYLAVHEGLHRRVAIKVMSKHLDEESGFSDRFMREARIVANLTHRNIVTVYDVNVYDGYHYIAMEYLPGGITLDHKIKQGISPWQGLDTVKQVAAALGYAHSKGIVHRDVKPENIMYREDGSAVLTDFGIARAADSNTKMTATGSVIGTPHYMSPEQAQGHEIGPFSDIYSLGVVLYETLTGKVPYDADSNIAVVFKHLTEPVPILEGELAIYQPVLDRMMAKDRAERYANCEAIIADIDALGAGTTADPNATLVNNATVINTARPASATTGRKITPAETIVNTRAGTTGKQVTTQTGTGGGYSNKLIYAVIAGIVAIAIGIGGYAYIQQNSENERLARQQQQREAQAKLAEQQRQQDEQAAQLKAEQEKQAEAQRLAEQRQREQEQAKLAAEQKAKAEAESEAREEELAQQRAAQAAEANRARETRERNIRTSLANAEQQLLNTQLSKAWQSFNDVLKIDSGNTQAKSGVTRVADRYLALAANEALKNNFDKAESYIKSAIQIDPTNSKLADTQAKVFDLKNQQLAKAAEAKRQQEQALKASTTETPEEPEKKRRAFGGF